MKSKSTKPKQAGGKKGGSSSTATPKSSNAAAKKPDTSLGPTPEFASAREFAQAIARERNLVEVGSALLGSQETKGASVRARMFETTLEYLYGKPVAAAPAEELPVRVVWDIPMNPSEEPAE